MDFIHKFIPKNPINASTQTKITESVKHAVTVFAKNYALQTQLVIVGNKELEYRLKEERKAQVDKDRNYKTRYYKRIHGEDAQVPDIPEQADPPTENDIWPAVRQPLHTYRRQTAASGTSQSGTHPPASSVPPADPVQSARADIVCILLSA